MGDLRREAYQGLVQALSTVPEGTGRWEIIAARLNSRGVKSLKGSTWTPENVRKVVGRHREVFGSIAH